MIPGDYEPENSEELDSEEDFDYKYQAEVGLDEFEKRLNNEENSNNKTPSKKSGQPNFFLFSNQLISPIKNSNKNSMNEFSEEESEVHRRSLLVSMDPQREKIDHVKNIMKQPSYYLLEDFPLESFFKLKQDQRIKILYETR